MRTLATLAEVKEWAGVKPEIDTSDSLLTRLLEGATQFVYSYLQIPTFAKRTYNETYDGHGMDWMVLRQFPILGVTAVSANGIPYVAASGNGISAPFTSGFVLLEDRLVLFGYRFPRLRNSVFVQYDAGYYVTDETYTLTDSLTASVSEHWLENGQVTLTDGTVLTKVTEIENDDEYTVADGVYTFSDNLEEAEVLISYSYVPADIVDAVINAVGERYKYMDRIGYSSKSLGGQETVSFSQNKVTPYVMELLNRYKRVVPI